MILIDIVATGETLQMADQPEPDASGDYYTARAIDRDNNKYVIYWPIVDDMAEAWEGACNWTAPERVERI